MRRNSDHRRPNRSEPLVEGEGELGRHRVRALSDLLIAEASPRGSGSSPCPRILVRPQLGIDREVADARASSTRSRWNDTAAGASLGTAARQ
jgi:hypothetical protein